MPQIHGFRSFLSVTSLVRITKIDIVLLVFRDLVVFELILCRYRDHKMLLSLLFVVVVFFLGCFFCLFVTQFLVWVDIDFHGAMDAPADW